MAADLSTDGRRIYAIGDIHGRYDLLQRMAAMIQADLAARPHPAPMVITLGDYVDRGPGSQAVIEGLAGGIFGVEHVALRGNHEWMLLSFLDNPALGPDWRQYGGLETLHSYGVPVGEIMRGRGFEEAAASLRDALPANHRHFLATLKSFHRVGDYFFCHAGVRPGVPLEQQIDEDLLWIRNEFLTSSAQFGCVVIHGHTPVEEAEWLENRINVDTGAYLTGRLSCAVLQDGNFMLIAT